jgi:hypothetical protein
MPRRGPAFPDAAWREILAAAEPHQPDNEAEARRALDDAIFEYVAGQPNMPALKRARADLETAVEKLSAATKALYHIRRRTPRSGDDDPDMPLRRLQAVLGVKRELEREIADINRVTRSRQGRGNPERARLYERLLSLWVKHFGGALSFATPPKGGLPYGPAIKFVFAISVIPNSLRASGSA